MTERHPPVRDLHLEEVAVRHPGEGCPVGATTEPRGATGSRKPEGD